MKTTIRPCPKKALISAGIVAGAVIAVCLAGCKIESADKPVRIIPDSAVLHKHQSVTLTAHRGYNYTWSLETEEWGVLSPRSGHEVVYTSLYEPAGELPVVQVVKVESTLYGTDSTGNAGGTGGGTTYVSRAEAYITHLPADEPANTPANE